MMPNLWRYALVLVRDKDRADDLVQDCLERAISHQRYYAPGTNLGAWLFTILLNLVRSQARRDRIRKLVPIDEEHPRNAVPAPQDEVLYLRDLHRAFARLPQSFQEALLLVAIEGMPYEQAAAVAGVPVGTIRSRLSRARDRLQDLSEAAWQPRRRLGQRVAQNTVGPRAVA